jgi:hypothetical protein
MSDKPDLNTPDFNTRLRQAVNSEPIPPYLESRIRAGIRASGRPRPRWVFRLAPIGVMAAVCLGLGIAYELGHLRMTVGSQESYIASVSNHVATLMRVGLGDHIHCSVFRKYPKTPPTAEEFVEKMGPQYSGLIPIVRGQIPTDYRMMLAHQCRYHGRRFIHLSLMNDSHLISLAITRKNSGESFAIEGMLPALSQSGIPMYQSDVQRFQISAFETRDYLVYFISDLSKDKNSEMMIALAPQVRDFLNKQEL